MHTTSYSIREYSDEEGPYFTIIETQSDDDGTATEYELPMWFSTREEAEYWLTIPVD